MPEAGKTFAIFELLRTCIKKSIVAMLPPTILFSRGEKTRAVPAQVCSLTSSRSLPARTVPAQSIFLTTSAERAR